MERVVVTGAEGMLGQAVLQAFGAAFETVAHRRMDGDLVQTAPTLAWMLKQRPQCIVHCAAYTDVDGCERDPSRAFANNGLATRNVALAGKRLGAAVCYVSSDYVFRGDRALPYREGDAAAPLNVYGHSKAIGEEHVRQHVSKAFIVRTSWLFGLGGKNFVRTMVDLLQGRDLVRVVNDQRGSPTYVRDLAAALVPLVQSERYGAYHITNAGTCSWFELGRAIRDRLTSGGRVEPCTTAEFPRPARRPVQSGLEGFQHRAAGFAPLRHWTEGLDAYLAELGVGRGAASPSSRPAI